MTTLPPRWHARESGASDRGLYDAPWIREPADNPGHVPPMSSSSPPSAKSEPPAQDGGSSGVLTPGLLAGFVVIIVVLIATLAVGIVNLENLYGTSAAVMHTYAVKDALQQLLAMTVDAETSERGFIITGAES